MIKSILAFFVFSFSLISAFSQNKITWNAPSNLATNSYGNMHPRVALDRAGNPLVIWGRMSDESLFFSRWNGTMFSVPIKLNPTWLKVATASWMGPDIAAKGDTIYVVVKRTPEASDTNHIYIIRSFNGGASFTTPVRVDFIADSISRFPTIAVEATGNPVVGFMKFNKSFLDSRWVVARSNDFGNTFLTDVKASGYSGANAEVCDCCPGALEISGNKTAMVYRDNLNDLREIWSGISNNNSTSFNTGFKADNTNWVVPSCPASGPDAVIVGDTLYSVFLSAGKGSYRNYLSKSNINNGVSNTSTNLTGNIIGLTQQNYPRIATDGKAAAIVWKQNVSGKAELPILFTTNIQKGFPLVYDTVDLIDITNADVVVGNGKVFVVWEDDNSGTIKYRNGTYSPALGVESIYNQEAPVALYPNPVSSLLNISWAFEKDVVISVSDMLGNSISEKAVPAGIKSFQMNTTQLESGIYFVSIKSEGFMMTKKFIRQ